MERKTTCMAKSNASPAMARKTGAPATAKTTRAVRPRARAATARLPQAVSLAVQAARDKKAADVVVLDLRKASGFTDFFVICTGNNPRQIVAIADAVRETLKKELGERPALAEGVDRSEWVLLDYFNFGNVFDPLAAMVHLQHPKATGSLITAYEKTIGKPSAPTYWFYHLIPQLPKSAIPALEAVTPKLKDRAADQWFDAIQALREKE